jgi:pimeloyl-ACP methyl ester carboxylesterase
MPPKSNSRRAGLIFYPGGLVEPEAYVSVLAPIAGAGHPVVIARMPLDLAVTAPGRAAEILEEDSVRNWAIGGHSLGGAMAARFLAREGEDFPNLKGLVLLASYPAGSDSLAQAGYPVLSIWASEDGLATAEDRAETRDLLPDDATIVTVEGGNHAGFGEYGPQDDDGERTIELSEQHRAVQALILEFLQELQVTVQRE